MVVLAGMGAAVLASSRDGSGGGHRGALQASPGTTVSASPGAAAGDIAAAAAAACRASYTAVSAAADYYATLNGHPAPNIQALGSMLKGPVTSTRWSLTISPSGQVEVATAGHPAAPGDANCSFAG